MSKAKELADRLVEIAGDLMWADHAEISKPRLEITAAELRRLDAENAQLRAELEAAKQQMERQKDEWLSWDAKRRHLEQCERELEAIYSAEPVAWMHESGNATYAGPDAGVAAYNIPLIQKPARI